MIVKLLKDQKIVKIIEVNSVNFASDGYVFSVYDNKNNFISLEGIDSVVVYYPNIATGYDVSINDK